MSWTIHVGKQAATRFRFLDPSLQAKLTEHAAAIAESPQELLARPTSRQQSGMYVYTYRSAVVTGLIMTLYFDGLDDEPPGLDLVGIAERMEDPM